MYKTFSFKKKLLATLVASSALGLSHVAFAEEVEEVVVTGIRASLTAAMDIKREAAGVVDAISAEDMGKMPDTNLAESLQRITGVSINRADGEGAKVTARGIGEELNMVTLNGRTMPVVENLNKNSNGTRAFDFSNIASEGINGVEVYKTGRASNPSGGLGATINIKTLKPLDGNAETKAVLGAKGVMDTTVNRDQGDKYTPEVNGLYSWANEEKTFGVSLVGSWQKRNSDNANSYVNFWDLKKAGDLTFDPRSGVQNTIDGTLPFQSKTDWAWADADKKVKDKRAKLRGDGTQLIDKGVPQFEEYRVAVDAAGNPLPTVADPANPGKVLRTPGQISGIVTSGLPAKGSMYNMPSDVRYVVNNNERIRENTQLTMQFKPVENLTATVDYTYAQNEITQNRHELTTWYDISKITEIRFNDAAVKSPAIYKETYPNGDNDTAFAQREFHGKTQNGSLGFNLAWEATDSLKFGLDYHNSQATNLTGFREAGTMAITTKTKYSDFTKDLPVIGATFGDSGMRDGRKGIDGKPYMFGNGNGVLDAGDMTSAMGNIEDSKQKSDVTELQLFGSVDLGDAGFFTKNAVDFGVNTRESANLVQHSDNMVVMGNWDGVDPKRMPDHYFRPVDFADAFPDYGSTTGDANFLNRGFAANVSDIFAYAEYENAKGIDPNNFKDFPNGKAQGTGALNKNSTVTEKVNAAYVQGKTSFDIGSMPSNLLLGARFENRDVTVVSAVQEPNMLEWMSDNDWKVNRSDSITSAKADASTSNFLPSLDFDMNVTDDIKTRFSYSQTLGLPGYGDLSPVINLDAYARSANHGDTALKPMQSDNIDLSVEWYYAESSYVSAGYFTKKVSNFIGRTTVKEEAFGLRDIRSGPRMAAFLKGVGGTASESAQFDAMVASELVDVNDPTKGFKDPTNPSTSAFADKNDPVLKWDMSVPVNDKDTTIDGFEFGVQHMFGESGFGVTANYTLVDAGVKFDNNIDGTQFAMVGLSDTANIMAFYDKDAWQARIAYNWRDAFLNSRNIHVNEPSYTAAFMQVDFSIGYKVTENLTVSAEGLNILGENNRTYGRNTDQMLTLEDLGARYAVGARYAF